jgi:hypothetical protein
MADECLKNYLDNIVETINSNLNHFIRLGKESPRQYRIEETSSSKLGWEKVSDKDHLGEKWKN